MRKGNPIMKLGIRKISNAIAIKLASGRLTKDKIGNQIPKLKISVCPN